MPDQRGAPRLSGGERECQQLPPRGLCACPFEQRDEAPCSSPSHATRRVSETTIPEAVIEEQGFNLSPDAAEETEACNDDRTRPCPFAACRRGGGVSASPRGHRRGASYTWSVAGFSRISIDPAVRFGKPCVKGTRITVGEVLGHLAAGMSESELLADFPQLAREDILECLAFAAERERRIVIDPAA